MISLTKTLLTYTSVLLLTSAMYMINHSNWTIDCEPIASKTQQYLNLSEIYNTSTCGLQPSRLEEHIGHIYSLDEFERCLTALARNAAKKFQVEDRKYNIVFLGDSRIRQRMTSLKDFLGRSVYEYRKLHEPIWFISNKTLTAMTFYWLTHKPEILDYLQNWTTLHPSCDKYPDILVIGYLLHKYRDENGTDKTPEIYKKEIEDILHNLKAINNKCGNHTRLFWLMQDPLMPPDEDNSWNFLRVPLNSTTNLTLLDTFNSKAHEALVVDDSDSTFKVINNHKLFQQMDNLTFHNLLHLNPCPIELDRNAFINTLCSEVSGYIKA